MPMASDLEHGSRIAESYPCTFHHPHTHTHTSLSFPTHAPRVFSRWADILSCASIAACTSGMRNGSLLFPSPFSSPISSMEDGPEPICPRSITSSSSSAYRQNKEEKEEDAKEAT